MTIVETGDELGTGLVPERKTRLFYWFDKQGVPLLSGVRLVEITDEGLSIVTRDGEPRFLAADTVIPALPFGSQPGDGGGREEQGPGGLRDRGLRQPGHHPGGHGRGLAGRERPVGGRAKRRPAGEVRLRRGADLGGQDCEGEDRGYSASGVIAWKVGLLKTLSRQAPLSCSLALPTE